MKKYPNSRAGWHTHYAEKFNKNESKFTAQLALWHYLLFLAFGERSTRTSK